MLHWLMDTLDEFSGYNRTALRVVGAMFLAPVLLLGGSAAYDELTKPEPTKCDDICQADLDKQISIWLEEIEFDPDKVIDEILSE